jgi:hypothetical protein
MTDNEVLSKVRKALLGLLEFDIHLLEVDASERSICHKLAEHLQRQFGQLTVDCEYNRTGSAKKVLGPHAVYPDIIVHTRNTKKNLLVLEVKKSGRGTSAERDKTRLMWFTRPPIRYRMGIFLRFGAGGEGAPIREVAIYKDGQEVRPKWQEELRRLIPGAGIEPVGG